MYHYWFVSAVFWCEVTEITHKVWLDSRITKAIVLPLFLWFIYWLCVHILGRRHSFYSAQFLVQLEKETISSDRNKLKEWLEGTNTNGLVLFIQREVPQEKYFFQLSSSFWITLSSVLSVLAISSCSLNYFIFITVYKCGGFFWLYLCETIEERSVASRHHETLVTSAFLCFILQWSWHTKSTN